MESQKQLTILLLVNILIIMSISFTMTIGLSTRKCPEASNPKHNFSKKIDKFSFVLYNYALGIY